MIHFYTRAVRAACALACAMLFVSLVATPGLAGSAPAPTAAALGDLDRALLNYELFTLDPAVTAQKVRAAGVVRLDVPSGAFDLALGKRDMRASSYREEITSSEGKKASARRDVTTYAGVATSLGGAPARFSIDERGLTGMIIVEDPIFVEPLSNFSLAGGPSDYVVYRASEVRPEAEPATCGATEAERVGAAVAKLESSSALVTTNQVVQLATEVDNEYASFYGSGTAANNEVLNIMNQVEGIYQSEVGLNFEIVYQHAWEPSAADPYSSNDAEPMLVEFRNHWNSNFTSVQRDLAHMWTGRDMTGSTIGIAYVGVVCSSSTYSYGVSQRYSSSPQRYILTAHEIGHNFNACHSNTSCNPSPSGCSNTVMQSSVGTGMTFCTFSRGQITSWVNSNSSCLPAAAAGSTIGIYASATATFFLKNSNAPGAADMAFIYGPIGATPVAGDWDGNGTVTVGVYAPATATFFLKNSNSPGPANTTFVYGAPNATPIVGDWDGNGTETIGIYQPSTATFFLKNSNTPGNADVIVNYGVPNMGWVPIVGDWNGDGRDTVGLYSPANGTFFLKNSNTPGPADMAFIYGPPNAQPLAGDWAGLGYDTVGICVGTQATFFLRNSNTPGPADSTVLFGLPPTMGLAGNWDGQ